MMALEAPRHPGVKRYRPRPRWAESTLQLAAALGAFATFAGIVLARGLRGLASQTVVTVTDVGAGALAYMFAAILVALLAHGVFQLLAVGRLSMFARILASGSSGVLLACASPAAVGRLPLIATLALSAMASLLGLVAGVVAVRARATRAHGALLMLLAAAGGLQTFGWETCALASERANLRLFQLGALTSSASVLALGGGVFVAAVWLATRSLFGRIFANAAIVTACALTYVAGRELRAEPSLVESVIRIWLASRAAPIATPVAPLAAFLGAASLLLAVVAVVEPRRAPQVRRGLFSTTALALLSNGALDVPLQSLAFAAAAQWTILSVAEENARTAAQSARRGGAAPTGEDHGAAA